MKLNKLAISTSIFLSGALYVATPICAMVEEKGMQAEMNHSASEETSKQQILEEAKDGKMFGREWIGTKSSAVSDEEIESFKKMGGTTFQVGEEKEFVIVGRNVKGAKITLDDVFNALGEEDIVNLSDDEDKNDNELDIMYADPEERFNLKITFDTTEDGEEEAYVSELQLMDVDPMRWFG